MILDGDACTVDGVTDKNQGSGKMFGCYRWTVGFCGALILSCVGCNQPKTEEAVTEAETQLEQAADTIAKDVGEAVEKGEQVAKEAGQKAKQLGEQAMTYLTPLKEKLGNLDSLREKPEELKKAVTELIQSIEEKSAEIKLPDVVSNALATTKEKLIALQQYLEGEFEQAQIDEHLKEISDSVKKSLGMSTE